MSNELERAVDDVVDSTVSSKIDTLATQLAERLQSDCAAIVEQIRKLNPPQTDDSIETLLLCLRKIQDGDSVVEIAGALVDGAAKFCGRAGLLINKGDNLLGFRFAGAVTEQQSDAFQELLIPLFEAASLEQAVDTATNVVSAGTAEDLSGALTGLLSLTAEDRVGLFPVRLRTKVLAVLYCDSRGENATPVALRSTPIEALISSAEGWIEAVSTRKR